MSASPAPALAPDVAPARRAARGGGVLRLVVGRLLATVPLVVGVAALVFVLLETTPGSPRDLILGDRPVAPEVRERIERAWGLDRPPVERFAAWVGAAVLHGDIGWSLSRSAPVTSVLADAVPPTLLLAGAALLLNLGVGLAAGVVSAARPGGRVDRVLTVAGLTAYGMPTFWLGLMAILGLAYLVPVFPASSLHSVGAERLGPVARALDLLWHLALPAAVLGLGSAAATTRFVRAGTLEALREPFVRAARARGVGPRRALWVHALRNALGPVVQLVGLSLPILLSGSLVVEVVFAWPGMGRLTYDAILAKDLPLVMTTTLLSAAMVVAGNLAADLALLLVDPRVRARSPGART